MTPQQSTTQLVNRIIRRSPRGITVGKLLKEMLSESDKQKIMLYFGSGRSLGGYLRSMESKGFVNVRAQGRQIIIKPKPRFTKRSRVVAA